VVSSTVSKEDKFQYSIRRLVAELTVMVMSSARMTLRHPKSNHEKLLTKDCTYQYYFPIEYIKENKRKKGEKGI
jgi:hypothetical protein